VDYSGESWFLDVMRDMMGNKLTLLDTGRHVGVHDAHGSRGFSWAVQVHPRPMAG